MENKDSNLPCINLIHSLCSSATTSFAVMAKKSKSKTVPANGLGSPEQQQSIGTTTALPSTSNPLESSTASTSGSSSITDNASQNKEARAVVPATSEEDVDQLPDIQVNKWSLHDLKTACDDAVKQVGQITNSYTLLCCTD